MRKSVTLLLAGVVFLSLVTTNSYAIGAWKKIWGPAGIVLVDPANILGPVLPEPGDKIYATELLSGDIYIYVGKPALEWQKIGGPMKKFAAAGGPLYGLSFFGEVYAYTGTPDKWTKIRDTVSEIYGGPTGLFATDSQTGNIYAYNCFCSGSYKHGWTEIGRPGKTFAVGGQGGLPTSIRYLYGLSPDGSGVFQLNFKTMKWTKIGGPAADIFAGGDRLYATNPQNGDIYEYNHNSSKWTRIGGPGKIFTVDDEGLLYGLAPDGSGVWQYDGTPTNWTKISGPVASICAGGRTLCAKDSTTSELLLYKKPNIDLLVLAHKDFLGALKPLQKHKDTTGIKTHIESWQSLAGRFNGNDQPESIKKGILTYKKHHRIKWVMLVGDCDRFPVRYLCRDVPDPKGYQANDLYYADLYKSDGSFDNWDGNRNRLYAQLLGTPNSNNIDKVDWHPDVAVARVPASNVTEVNNYVKKIISYELKAHNSSWFKRALLVTGCGDCGDAVGLSDYISKNYLSGFTIIKHYHTKVWPSYPINQNDIAGSMDKRAKPMTDYINKGVGFITYYGHGSWKDFCWVYDKRHLNDLNNIDKLPVVFSRGCQNGEFAPSPPWQDYYDVNDVFHAKHHPALTEIVPAPNPIQPGKGMSHDCDLEARTEDWLVYRNTGAIAFIGCAGTANPHYADQLLKDFFKAYKLGHSTFGDMWVYMVQQFLDGYGYFDKQGNTMGKGKWERNAVWNTLVRFNPFGDPSLRVGGISGK